MTKDKIVTKKKKHFLRKKDESAAAVSPAKRKKRKNLILTAVIAAIAVLLVLLYFTGVYDALLVKLGLFREGEVAPTGTFYEYTPKGTANICILTVSYTHLQQIHLFF